MIKQFVLGLKKPEKIQNLTHHSFASAKSFGIIINISDIDAAVAEAIKAELVHAEKEVTMLKYVDKSSEAEDTFSPKEISILGKINSDFVLHFLDQKFDFLIVLDQTCEASFEYIIKKAKSDYKVGITDNALYQLVVKSGSLDSLAVDIMKYLKMIQYE